MTKRQSGAAKEQIYVAKGRSDGRINGGDNVRIPWLPTGCKGLGQGLHVFW